MSALYYSKMIKYIILLYRELSRVRQNQIFWKKINCGLRDDGVILLKNTKIFQLYITFPDWLGTRPDCRTYFNPNY